MMQIDPNEWTISAPQPGSKGGKTCLVSSSSNKPIEINMGLGNPFGCPWGASSFDDDATQTRVNLDMTLDDESADLFRQIDEWLIAYAIKHKDVFSQVAKAKLMHKLQITIGDLQGRKKVSDLCCERKSI